MEAVMATNHEVPGDSVDPLSAEMDLGPPMVPKQRVEYGRKRLRRNKQLAEARRQRWTEDALVNKDGSVMNESLTTAATTEFDSTVESDCTAEKKMKMLHLSHDGKTGYLWYGNWEIVMQ